MFANLKGLFVYTFGASIQKPLFIDAFKSLSFLVEGANYCFLANIKIATCATCMVESALNREPSPLNSLM